MSVKLTFLSIAFILLLGIDCAAADINWRGTTSSNWNTASNWSSGTVPGPADNVFIGYSVSFTNPPTISTTTTVQDVVFGAVKGATLTVNSGVLLTARDVIQRHSTSNTSVTTNITGLGTISCRIFYAGDAVPPPTPSLGILNGNVTNLTTVNLSIQNLNVSENLFVNTTSATANILGTNFANVNNNILNILSGTVKVTSHIQVSHSSYVNQPGATVGIITYPAVVNNAQLVLNPASNTTAGTQATLSLGGAFYIGAAGATLDFYGPGTGTSTLIYAGGSAQTVYTSPTGFDTSPSVYQNISFSGLGVKTVQSGATTVGGDWNSAEGKVDITTNSATFTFNGGTQTLTDASSDGGNGVTFANVNFQGTGNKTLSGKFAVSSSHVLTMAGTATLVSGGNLTLNSDATGSAAVAALPTGTAITGNVNVQRFIKGSSTDLSKRGYRMISSAVYTGSPGGVRSFDLNYLLNDTYVSGPVGGGFNAPTGTNPSLYLYREDISSSNAAFTSGNYKGINKINNANAYDIGTQKRFTTTNVNDTTTNIPIGNGVLFFFRGNKSNNATQTGSKVVAPYDYPEDVTFTQVGALNTGTVTVKLWYRPSTILSYTNNSAIANANVRGFALVGNPYASTINFEKFNRNGTSSSIYGSGFPAASATQGKIWIFNPVTRQYDGYQQTTTPTFPADTTTTIRPTGSLYTGDASNMIASGQGFFIRATSNSQRFSFRESAKTTTQPVAANLIRLMSTPATLASMTNTALTLVKPILRLKLIKDTLSTDDVVIAFNNKTGTAFSDADDVEDMGGNGALVSLSLLSSDNVSAAIKQMQLPETGEQVISLAADATTTGTYQLTLAEMQNMPVEYDLWLKDAYTKDSLDIRHNTTYTFNIYKNNPETYGSKRFTLLIRKNNALAMHTLGFSAQKTVAGSRLTWTAEHEGTNYRFNVHRSADDGLSYQTIGQQTSSGSGDYLYVDIEPLRGKNKYRIAIENIKTGLVSYTNDLSLTYADSTANQTASIMVYPNPTAQVVNVKIPDTNENFNGSYTISILNSSGKLIKRAVTNEPTWQENVASLLPGTYMVQVVNNRDKKIEGKTKFVKL